MHDDRQTKTKFLVVDDQPFQRRLIMETLRTLGAVHIEQAVSPAHCFETLTYFTPDIIVTDWDMDAADGVELVRRLRAGEAGATIKKRPVIMVTERNRPGDIEIARNSGIDEFLLRPFNTASLLARVDAVTKNRRDFVESVVYVGPCRRRKMLHDYEGPLRRLFDEDSEEADPPEVLIRKGLARSYVERIASLLAQLDGADRRIIRDIFLVSGQLHALALEMKDRLLIAAAESLFNYVQGVGASPRLDTPVVSSHVWAMLQLLDLPNSQIDLRQTVTTELAVMVRKKLKTDAA